jgi:hypothetical protein
LKFWNGLSDERSGIGLLNESCKTELDLTTTSFSVEATIELIIAIKIITIRNDEIRTPTIVANMYLKKLFMSIGF